VKVLRIELSVNRCQIDPVIERAHALDESGRVPLLRPSIRRFQCCRTLIVIRHPLGKHLPMCSERWRLEEIECDAKNSDRADAVQNGIHVRRIGVEHLGDALQVIQTPHWIGET